MLLLPSARTCETRLPSEAGIPRIWDTLVPVISRIDTDTVYSFSPKCGLEGPVLVSGCCTGSFYYADRPETLGFGSGSRAKLMGRDFRDLGACLRHHFID